MFDKVYLFIIAGLLVIAGILYTLNQVQQNTILELNIQNENLKAVANLKELELSNSKDAQKALEELIIVEKQESANLAKQLEEIDNAPTSDNGDVSPVLRDAIKRLPND